jgi:hypothetical protein
VNVGGDLIEAQVGVENQIAKSVRQPLAGDPRLGLNPLRLELARLGRKYSGPASMIMAPTKIMPHRIVCPPSRSEPSGSRLSPARAASALTTVTPEHCVYNIPGPLASPEACEFLWKKWGPYPDLPRSPRRQPREKNNKQPGPETLGPW